MNQQPETSSSERQPGRGLALLLISMANLFSAPVIFLLPLYLEKELEYSGLQIGLVFGAFNITAIVGAMPFGFGNDRRRSRVLVAVSCILVCIAAFALSGTARFLLFVAAFIVFGIGVNLFRISLDALIYRTNLHGHEGRGLADYHSFRHAGFGVGILLASCFLDSIGFPAVLVVLAIASLLMLPLAWRLPPTGTFQHDIETYRADLRRPEVYLYLAWMFLFSSHWGAEQTSYALFLRHGLNLSTAGLGLYMFGEFVAVCLLLPWLGRRADKGASLDKILLAGLLASGIGHIGMIYPHVAVSFLFRFIHGFGDAAVFLLIALGAARLFSLERIGGHSGLVMFVTLLGAFTGSLAYGPLGDAVGWGIPLAVSGGITLLLIPIYLYARNLAKNA